MKRIKMSGGDMDGFEMEVRDSLEVAYAVHNPRPNVLVNVAYAPTKDPSIWAMRSLTPEEEEDQRPIPPR